MTNKELMSFLDGMVKRAKVEHVKNADEAGPTSHPIGNEDPGNVSADEGEYGREKAQDVKDAIPMENVQDSGDLIGDASPKGDVVQKYDAEEEGSKDTKKDKDDPGTSTPYKVASDKMKDLLANIAVYKKSAEEVPAVGLPNTETKEVTETPAKEVTEECDEKEAEALGRTVGNAFIDSAIGDAEMIDSIYKKAGADALAVAEFLYGYEKAAQELPPEVAAELLAAGEGGEEMPPEAGGAPSPEEMLMGGGGGGEEAMMDGGGEEGLPAGEEEAALAELAQALDEAGITPEELVAAAEGAMSGEEGGMPPEMAPPMEEPKIASLSKNAADMMNIMKASTVLLNYKNK
jgi:hypothetical protein